MDIFARSKLLRITLLICTGAVGMLFLIARAAIAQDFVNDRAERQFTRERTYDVQHLVLDLRFNIPEGQLFGRATTTLTPINDGLRTVVLDGVDLQIDSVLRGREEMLSFSTTDDQISIDLGRAYKAGDKVTFTIVYHARPQMGVYFVRPDASYPDKPTQIWTQGEMEESRHWFPCYDAPNDMYTTELYATVPEDFTAVSNGKLVKRTEDALAGTATYHWREDVPHVTYLTSLVAGNFVEVRDEWQGIPITYYVDPRDRDFVERSFAKTPDMVRFYSEMIGYKYPYEKYAQTTIRDFHWGGMENASATTLTHRTLHDKRAHLDYQSDGLVAHELAHQWWGDLITTHNWNHIWLNEGFATYFDYLYVEHDRGPDEFHMRVLDARESYLNEDSSEYRRAIVTDYYDDPGQMFDAHSYEKGACVLHMLRYLLGDELWWKAIRHYANTYAKQTVRTADFQAAIETATGQPLEWFFDQWVFHASHPEYEVSWQWNEPNQAIELSVAQIQKTDTLTPLFRMPIDIDVTGSSGTKRFRIEVADRAQTFFLPVAARPDFVEFDPDDWVLKELMFEKGKQELLAQLRRSKTIAGRMRAAESLADHPGDGQVIDALGDALVKDKAWGVRARAAKSLGEIGTPEARDALLPALEDPESRVRRKAIEALGEFKKDMTVARALLNQFERDSSYYAQAEVVKALAKMRAPKAFDACVKALAYDSYSEVIRQAAFEGLADLRDAGGIDEVLPWTAYGKPTRARTAAVKAVGSLAKHDEARRDDLRDHLIELLDDPHFRVRRAVMEALGDLGDSEAIAALERSVATELYHWSKELAREALREIREPEASGDLASVRSELDELKETNRALRQRLESLESRLGTESADATESKRP